jgi:serine protease Do
MMKSKLGTLATLVLLGGCASVSVYGVVGDENDLYTGSATGFIDRSGTIELKNAKGNVCKGDFKYGQGLRGTGIIGCDDGQTAHIVFNGLSPMSGYGVGTSNTGRPVAFTYGLSREQSARYLGLGRAGIPAAGGAPSTGAASPPPASGKEGTGTGFFVSRQGHVMTNEHVVRGCAKLNVVQIAGGTTPATLVAADAANDVAVIKVATAPAAVAAFRAGSVRQGETVVAYGFPLSGLVTSGGTFTTGTVSALAGLRDDTRYFQLSVPIQPGNSGGPVLDASGAVAGIATASINEARVARQTGAIPQNVNFALKADVARTVLDAQGIRPETAAGGRELSTPDLAQRARSFSVRVECRAS